MTFVDEFERNFQRVSLRPNKPDEPVLNKLHFKVVRGDNTESGVSRDDFYAYMPTHSYIYTPTREMWPAASVNARVPSIPTSSGKVIPASAWLDQHRAVEQMTWAPGLPMLINNKLISDGG